MCNRPREKAIFLAGVLLGALRAMAYENPTVEAFKSFFARNFPFGTDPTKSVTDDDIANAMVMTNGNINQCLFGTQAIYNPAYLNLTAHFLITMLQSAAGGIQAVNSFLETAKSVGAVSQTFAIPEAYMKNPLWAMYMRTPYGAAYLMAILPGLTGQMFTVGGTTQP